MNIELLVIPNCPNGEGARVQIETALADLCMHDATLLTTTVGSIEAATLRGFSGSPTILIEGRDPFAPTDTSPAVACRVYPTPDGLRGVPGLPDLRRALKEAAASGHSN